MKQTILSRFFIISTLLLAGCGQEATQESIDGGETSLTNQSGSETDTTNQADPQTPPEQVAYVTPTFKSIDLYQDGNLITPSQLEINKEVTVQIELLNGLPDFDFTINNQYGSQGGSLDSVQSNQQMTTYRFTPSSAGSYTLWIEFSDAQSSTDKYSTSVAYTVIDNSNGYVAPTFNSVELYQDGNLISASQLEINKEVTVQIELLDGTPGFDFWINNQYGPQSGSWENVKSDQRVATYTFTPLNVGSYTLWIEFTDAQSATDEYSTSVAYSVIDNSNGYVIPTFNSVELYQDGNLVSASQLEVNKEVTVQIELLDGLPDFYFTIINQNGSPEYIQSNQRITNYTFTPSSVGNYSLSIEFTDAQSTTDIYSTTVAYTVIDNTNTTGPVFDFTALLGGNGMDRVQGTYIDENGYIFIAGQTGSRGLAVGDVFQATKPTYNESNPNNANDYESSEGFVGKLSQDGQQIIWLTYFGGSNRDALYAVRTDSLGNVYVVGTTGSPDFPTAGTFPNNYLKGTPATNALLDVFVAKLDPNGKNLIWSNLIGGTTGSEETPRGSILIDEQRDRVYVSGVTSAADFPTTTGVYQEQYNANQEAFVFALSLDGSTLVTSTYVGGSGGDYAASGIVQNPVDGSIYISGVTNSSDLIPASAAGYQSNFRSSNNNPDASIWSNGDGFIIRLDPDLTSIISGTYIGGPGFDEVSHNQGISINSKGEPVVAIATNSSDLFSGNSAPGFDKTINGSYDGALAIFSADLKSLVAGTYIGGSGDEELHGVAVGPADRVFVTGGTMSDNFPIMIPANELSNNISTNRGSGQYATISIFSDDLASQVYSGLLGGPVYNGESQRGRSFAVGNNKAVVGGTTGSSSFPNDGYFTNTFGTGYRSAFIGVMSLD